MLPKLQTNDLIYICSPAKAIEKEHVHFAKEFFIQNGYRVEIATHAMGSNGYFSGTVQERISDFQHGLNHPEAKVILCARGGYGCMQIMDKLDWSSYENNPKHLVGFSDVTAFHLILAQKNIPSLHATMPLNFMDNTPESLRSLLSVLKGTPEVISAGTSPFNQTGIARGKVIGGNLAMVHALLPRMKKGDFTDKILFLEDVGEHLYQIDRMFYGLMYSGSLEEVSGLLLGGFTNISDTESPFGKSLEEIILAHVLHRKIPVAFGLPCGHQSDNQALILGGAGVLTVEQGGSKLIQSFRENPT